MWNQFVRRERSDRLSRTWRVGLPSTYQPLFVACSCCPPRVCVCVRVFVCIGASVCLCVLVPPAAAAPSRPASGAVSCGRVVSWRHHTCPRNGDSAHCCSSWWCWWCCGVMKAVWRPPSQICKSLAHRCSSTMARGTGSLWLRASRCVPVSVSVSVNICVCVCACEYMCLCLCLCLYL